jgi:hypothetical protein
LVSVYYKLLGSIVLRFSLFVLRVLLWFVMSAFLSGFEDKVYLFLLASSSFLFSCLFYYRYFFLVYLSDHFFGYTYCSSFFCICMPFIIYWLFKKLREDSTISA